MSIQYHNRFIEQFCRVWDECSSAAEVAEKMVMSKEAVRRSAKYLRTKGYLLKVNSKQPQPDDLKAIEPDRVCIYAPGSPEKIAELQRRASLGMHLHHPLDANGGNAVNKMPISKPFTPRSKTRFID